MISKKTVFQSFFFLFSVISLFIFRETSFLYGQNNSPEHSVLSWQKKSVTQWEEILKASLSETQARPDLQLQWYAAYALGQYGQDAKSAVNTLISRAQVDMGQDDYVRAATLRSLGQIQDVTAIPVLVAELESPYRAILRNAAWALGNFNAQAMADDRVIPALEKLLTHEDPPTRAQAAAALWKIAKNDHALETLLKMIQSRKSYEIYESVHVIQEIAPLLNEKRATFAKMLTARLSSKDSDTSRACVEALCALGTDALTSVKTALETQKDPMIRMRMISILATVTADSEWEFFLNILNHPEETNMVKIAALRALKNPPDESRQSVREILVRIINDENSPQNLVREATETLKTL
ncbi:MAG: HEAT repeat domain-containing protein [Planctomycetia bacterium]|nr:HEAT repeat domain-containing protein [Planctomycetia bacterium]